MMPEHHFTLYKKLHREVKVMVKDPQRKTQTKANLMEAFWLLYQTRRIEHISIKDITELAGYNRSTFYEYFTDVYDLLEQIEDNLISLIQETLVKNLSDPEDLRIIERMACLFEDQGKYLSVLLGVTGDPSFADKFKVVLKPAILKTMKLNGEDTENQLLFAFTCGGILSALSYWYDNRKPITAKEFISVLRAILMKGSLSFAMDKNYVW
jgi:AcrR family transcriptional regulator